MLLAVDVGNTNITFGLFKGTELLHQFRAESARGRTADEFAILIRQMLLLRGISITDIKACIIASVVPVLTEAMVQCFRRGLAREPLVVGPGIRTGISVLCENPREVGADRIVNAVAAFDMVRKGAIVIDFGTATTFDCVSAKGEFLGGCIVPGIQIGAEALFTRASRLHRVDLVAPPTVIGTNLIQSLQAGILYGYAGIVDGLVSRLKAELAFPLAVIATGGLAPLVATHTSAIEQVVDSLTLDGLRTIYERNS